MSKKRGISYIEEEVKRLTEVVCEQKHNERKYSIKLQEAEKKEREGNWTEEDEYNYTTSEEIALDLEYTYCKIERTEEEIRKLQEEGALDNLIDETIAEISYLEISLEETLIEIEELEKKVQEEKESETSQQGTELEHSVGNFLEELELPKNKLIRHRLGYEKRSREKTELENKLKRLREDKEHEQEEKQRAKRRKRNDKESRNQSIATK